jgi:hypothetical protein
MQWQATQVSFPDGNRWRVVVGARTFDLELPALPRGPARLLALEDAVHRRLGLPARPPPSPPRFRVDVHEHHHGGLFELEVDTVWTIVDVAAGRAVRELRGGSSSSYDGAGWSGGGSSGVDEVILGGDGLRVLSRSSDRVMSEPLTMVGPPAGA